MPTLWLITPIPPQVTHASKYPAPVLSLGISPDCQLLAVGMADGTLSVRRHERPSAAAADQAKAQARRHYQPRLTAANYRCAMAPHAGMHTVLLMAGTSHTVVRPSASILL